MRFVELKSVEQLDTQSLHRVRDRLVGERTALLNQLRAILLERGIAVPQGRRKLERYLAAMLECEDGQVSPRVRSLLEDMAAEWRELDRRIEAFDDEFAALAKSDDAARRLATIPGIGVLNATALVAAIGNGAAFAPWARSRCLARPGAAPDDDGRQAAASGDQQAGQQIPPQAAGAWCPGGPAFAVGQYDAAWEMDKQPRGADAQKYCNRRAGQ
jgi:transposase